MTMSTKRRKIQESTDSCGPPSKRQLLQIPEKLSDVTSSKELKNIGQKLVKSSELFLKRGPPRPQLGKNVNWKKDKLDCKDKNEKEKQVKNAQALYNQELLDHEIEAKKKIEIEILLQNAPCLWDEQYSLASIEKQVQSKVKNDEELNGYYKRDIRETIDAGILEYLVRILQFQFNARKRENVKFPESLVEHINDTKYEPPIFRTPLATMEQITGKKLSFFCDIPNTDLSNLRKELVFKNLTKSFVDENKYPELAKFTKKAESDEYVIRCKCCKKGNIPIVPCWQNPECHCFKVNQRLQKLQYQTKEGHKEITNFHTFDPKIVSDLDFSHTVGFACSELCACQGKCDNNVTLIPEKGIYPLEVYRKNTSIGFGVRTMAAIPAGTVITEFAGEIMDKNVIEDVDQDYAYRLSTNYRAFIKRCRKGSIKWDRQFKKELRQQLSNEWFINPKRKGNVGRFFSHSCFPNLSAVQVFQKGFSPAHCRVFMVTQTDAFPGVELTFSYGSAFIKKQLDNGCQCRSISCENTLGYQQFSKLSESTLKSFCALQHYGGYQRFQKIVSDSATVKCPPNNSV